MKMIKLILCLCIVFLFEAGAAQAIMVGGLDTDPLAMTGEQGLINVSTAGSFICNMTYAVYDLKAITYNGFDPSWGDDQYLYAYQVFNLGNSTTNLNTFSVLIPQDVTADNIAYDWMKGATSGIPSSSQLFTGGSAEWQFNNITVVPAKNSVVLIFTSDFAPGPGTASFEADGIVDYIGATVPVPTPEPLSIILFGTGVAAILKRREKIRV